MKAIAWIFRDFPTCVDNVYGGFGNAELSFKMASYTLRAVSVLLLKEDIESLLLVLHYRWLVKVSQETGNVCVKCVEGRKSKSNLSVRT